MSASLAMGSDDNGAAVVIILEIIEESATDICISGIGCPECLLKVVGIIDFNISLSVEGGVDSSDVVEYRSLELNCVF